MVSLPVAAAIMFIQNMKPVLFNNTVLRDGHQSMAATRMTTPQMLPAAPILDGMGFNGLETWGGATIDSCLRFLNENPFDRLAHPQKGRPENAADHAAARPEHRPIRQLPR